MSTLESNNLLQLRLATASDKAFILSSWLKGQRFGHDFFKAIEPSAYYTTYSAQIEKLLALPTTAVVICCLSEEPDVIIGYSITTVPDTLHWVFVKEQWRKQGVANRLVAPMIKTVTSITKPGLAIARKRNYTFNPFK